MRFSEGFYQLLQRLDKQLEKNSDTYSDGIRLIYDKIILLIQKMNTADADTDLAGDILEILDDFSYSQSLFRQFGNKDNQTVHNYTKFLSRELLVTLKNAGIEEIPCADGERFDPVIHKAINTVSDEKYEHETVITVIKRGFRYFSGVIMRFVHVIVGMFRRK